MYYLVYVAFHMPIAWQVWHDAEMATLALERLVNVQAASLYDDGANILISFSM